MTAHGFETIIIRLDEEAPRIGRELRGWQREQLAPLLEEMSREIEDDTGDVGRLGAIASQLVKLIEEEAKYRPWLGRILEVAPGQPASPKRAMPDFDRLQDRAQRKEIRNHLAPLLRRVLRTLRDEQEESEPTERKDAEGAGS